MIGWKAPSGLTKTLDGEEMFKFAAVRSEDEMLRMRVCSNGMLRAAEWSGRSRIERAPRRIDSRYRILRMDVGVRLRLNILSDR